VTLDLEGGGGEPVAIAEIAERLKVKRSTVDVWRYRGVLPEPRWELSGRPLWAWGDIEAWARETNRLPEEDPAP
jgi:hypothetical protein